MFKYMKPRVAFIVSFFWVISCFANNSDSLGTTARKILEPLLLVGQLIQAICIIAGVGFMVGSLFRYKHHRQNPVEATLSSCIALLLAGLALLALAFIPMPK